MEYSNIIVQKGKIAHILLNRPEKRNAINTALSQELVSALRELDKEKDTAVIILSGAGKGFCAGGDLEAMTEDAGVLAGRELKTAAAKLWSTMAETGKVIISQVHGFALAGGFGLAMMADLTMVSDDCKLGMPEIKRAIFPFNIMNPLARMMPQKRLLEMAFTGNNITSQQALEWGLVNRVLPAEELEAETWKLAESIACHSTTTLRLGKQAYYDMRDMDYFTAFRYLTEVLTINTLTEDAKEGVNAFFEKRDPTWKNM